MTRLPYILLALAAMPLLLVAGCAGPAEQLPRVEEPGQLRVDEPAQDGSAAVTGEITVGATYNRTAYGQAR